VLSGAFVVCGALVSACSTEVDADDIGVDVEAVVMDDQPEVYPREVDANGAFTCELTLAADYPAIQVPPDLERDRMIMSRQRGMLVKYLPLRIGAVGPNGEPPNLYSGGRYLFNKAKQAARYHDFVANEYTLDGVQFLDREIFVSNDCHHYSVVGAYELTPLHDTHALIRVERFTMDGEKPVKKLKSLWPQLQAEASAAGMAAVWLIYNESESIAAVVYLHDRFVPRDPAEPDDVSLPLLSGAFPLGHLLQELGWSRTLDTTHWILTIWHPFEDGDHGEPSDWPWSPPLPAPSCGDGVCEVSRGESEASCVMDCPTYCGNGRCQPNRGENDHNCPGDCGG
jgi:hypothetical protein